MDIDRVPSDEALVQAACDIAARARANGNHPFGALLAGPEGDVVLEAENTVTTSGDCTEHAETNLVRMAVRRHDSAFLETCTLVSSAEPCAMCAGAIYWSGIGRVVYGLAESDLARFTGADPLNPTMSLPARVVLGSGQRPIEVVGPVAIDAATRVHEGFWDPTRRK